MQKGKVYRNGTAIGTIMLDNEGQYTFTYNYGYLQSTNALAISVNFPLQEEAFVSDELFPFFFNMLSEGSTKKLQCRTLRIDEDDHFTRLLKTTGSNTIGSITIKEISKDEANHKLGRDLGELLGEIEEAYEEEVDTAKIGSKNEL